MGRRIIGLVLIVVGIIGVVTFPLYAGSVWSTQAYGATDTWNPTTIGQQPSTRESPISFDDAIAMFQNYIASTRDSDLVLREVMEMENNFYAIVYEKSTGIGAFELLIWKRSQSSGMMGGGMGMGGMMGGVGIVVPEPGPNMMWNTKYGMMQGMMGSPQQSGISAQMPIDEEKAHSIAEEYLSQNFPGADVEGINRFYGHYTLDFEKDGKIVGMFSINGYTGQVWYHSWHGYFIQEKELA